MRSSHSSLITVLLFSAKGTRKRSCKLRCIYENVEILCKFCDKFAFIVVH